MLLCWCSVIRILQQNVEWASNGALVQFLAVTTVQVLVETNFVVPGKDVTGGRKPVSGRLPEVTVSAFRHTHFAWRNGVQPHNSRALPEDMSDRHWLLILFCVWLPLSVVQSLQPLRRTDAVASRPPVTRLRRVFGVDAYPISTFAFSKRARAASNSTWLRTPPRTCRHWKPVTKAGGSCHMLHWLALCFTRSVTRQTTVISVLRCLHSRPRLAICWPDESEQGRFESRLNSDRDRLRLAGSLPVVESQARSRA